ncbi:MAG: hypothetical protein SFT92_05705 [Rickettsiales bacterium]|nr:hypothetical protein [Rickettsiales bacterium]
MTELKPNPDDLTRIILLIYGMMENGKPFWAYLAVKPTKYKDFNELNKAGKIDLYKFESYGEIIIAGEGKSPPDEITLKVAEMYQTDPATMFKPIDPEAEVKKRMDAVSAALAVFGDKK